MIELFFNGFFNYLIDSIIVSLDLWFLVLLKIDFLFLDKILFRILILRI